MRKQNRASYVFHLFLAVIIILEAGLMAVRPATARPEESVPQESSSTDTTINADVPDLSTSAAFANNAQQLVTEQLAYEEPSPVAVGPALPPGTVRNLFLNPFSQVFLPVVTSSDDYPEDIALAPDTWISATEQWRAYELGQVDLGVLTLRFPPTGNVQSPNSTNQVTSLSLHQNGQIIQVLAEERTGQSPESTSSSPHPAILNYQTAGFNVREVSVKGVNAWEITATDPDETLCKEIIVGWPEAWLRFQLSTEDNPQLCQDDELFLLILSSIQIGSDVNVPSTPSSPAAPEAPEGINYNRNAAYDYAAAWWSVNNNNDGHHYWCSGIACDGAHYLAHFMQAGGFPIHWNVNQDHNNSIVANIASQRSYVLNNGYAYTVASASSLNVGDIIYINNGTSWCWGQAVIRMSGGWPYISTHSVNTWNQRYDLYYCGTASNHDYEFLRIDDSADPMLYSGITLSPETQQQNGNVAVSFSVRNYGGQSVTLDLRANASGAGTWSVQSCTMSANATCTYNQTRTFSTLGPFNTCAQMRIGGGSWQNIPVTGSGIACRNLNIVPPADVRLRNAFDLSPNELDHNGGTVQAAFAVQNYGGLQTIERFRAQTVSGPVVITFPASGDITLSPGGTYSYNQTASFTQPGVYEVIAEHRVSGVWTALIGDGSDIVRVLAPPPPEDIQNKGNPPGGGNEGEPVHTGTGNYFYGVTDLSDSTPGLFMSTDRWYNALDAATVQGPFGYGTSWTYGMAITWRPDKSALVTMGDGHVAYYLGNVNQSNPSDMSGTYFPQEEHEGLLVRAANGTATLTMPDQVVYHFDAAGLLSRITHPYPAEIIVIRNAGRPVQLVHSNGVTYTISYVGSNISTITSSNGRTVSYTYTPAGDLATFTRPDSSTYIYTFDTNHRLTEARDPNNHAYVRNVYDAQGRVVTQYDQTGKASTFVYDQVGPFTTIEGRQMVVTQTVFIDAIGNPITHTYDANLFLIAETDALGYTVHYTRDTQGNITQMQDKNGEIWTYTYDSNGNLLAETDPLNHTWSYTYDSYNNRLTQTDPLGHMWVYEYDANNRLVKVTDPLGYDKEYVYDAGGQLILERDELNAETQYGYNDLGWQTVITDALGNMTQIGYDAWGNQTVYTDANGHVATFVYDPLNRLVQSTDPMGTVITYTYDLMGNLLTQSDGMGHFKTYTYDAYDRVVVETDFNGNPTYYAYDALGRTTIITDSLDYTTVYTYDALGQLVAEKDKSGTITTYEYDPVGRLIKKTDALGRITEYIYDDAGRQTEVRRPCAVCTGGVAVLITTYDEAGRVIAEEDARGATTHYAYDDLSRVAVITDTYGYTTAYSYDPVGRQIQMVDPVGAITQYQYDLIGQLITTTNALGYQVITTYDAVGNVTATRNERGYTTTQIYDANDRLIETVDPLRYSTHYTYDPAGRMLTATDPLSRTITYGYDPQGNQITVTDARGYTTQTHYDTLNHPVAVIDSLGHVTTTGYDPVGRVISQANALGYTWVYAYDVVGRKVAEQTPLGYVTTYTFDSADNLVSRQEPTGAIWQFAFDASGNQTSQTNPLGHTWTYQYDLLNRQIQETDPHGGIIQSEYDPVGRLVRQVDPRGAVTTYSYNLLGQQTQITNALGYTQVSGYDGAGNPVSQQDERGFVTTYVYDALNRPIAQTDPLNHTRYTLYDEAGQVDAEVDFNGYTTWYGYDLAGNQIQVTDPLSHTITLTYDALNRSVTSTDPLSRTTTTQYDAIGQVITQTTPSGRVTVTTYDADGRAIIRTDAAGNDWLTAYDAAGRPISETDPLGRVKHTMYDAFGQVISQTDAISRTTTFTYDALGRLTVVTGPDGTTQHYTYDSMGNVLSEQDGNGHITRYQYDLLGRLRRKIDPLGRIWFYGYDATGNHRDIYTPANHQIQQLYDALGRLTSKTYDGVPQVEFAYDANGNRKVMTDTVGVTTYVYDPVNRLLQSSDSAGRTVQYGYDAAGQQITLTYPDSTIVQQSYTADGELHQLVASGDTTTYTYDALGRQIKVVQGNGVTVNTTYDAVGNTLDIVQKEAGGSIFSHHHYEVDAVDRRVEMVEALPQGTFTTTYGYDDLDRLISSISSDGEATYYSFDDAGNRLVQWGTRLNNGVPEIYNVAYVYNNANQLTQSVDSVRGITNYTYDADGNRIGMQSPTRRDSYGYDAESRLIEAHVELWNASTWVHKNGVFERYSYDGNGRRVAKAELLVGSSTILSEKEYRYDDVTQWNVLQTYDGAVSRFVYDKAFHKLSYWEGVQAGYLQNDGLGSVTGSTNSSGIVTTPDGLMRYSDYGEEQGSSSVLSTEDGFTGYQKDTYTGLNYARNRYYDAITGLFISLDTYPANQLDLLGLHRYLYVQATPTNATDPLGLYDIRTGRVEAGDTLWSIANNTGVSINEILGANPQYVGTEHVSAGDILRLPACRSAKCQQLRMGHIAQVQGTSPSECGQKASPPPDQGNNNPGGGNNNKPQNPPSKKVNFDRNSKLGQLLRQVFKNFSGFELEFNPSDVLTTWKKLRVRKLFNYDLSPKPLKNIKALGKKFDFYAKATNDFNIFDAEPTISIRSDGYSGELCFKVSIRGEVGATFPLHAAVSVDIYGFLGAEAKGCIVYDSREGFNAYVEIKAFGGIGGRIYANIDIGFAGARIGLRVEAQLKATWHKSVSGNNPKPFALQIEAAPFYGLKYWPKCKNWCDTDLFVFKTSDIALPFPS